MDREHIRQVAERFRQSYWNLVSCAPSLSDSFIRSNEHNLNPQLVMQTQNLSPDLRKRFEDRAQ